MRVIFCGTGSAVFSRERACSGLVLETGESAVMLDCGPGALRGALQAGARLTVLRALVLSHLHADHALDLTALQLLQRLNAAPVLPVYGPPGTAAAVAAVAAFSGALAAAAAAPTGNRPEAEFAPMPAVEIEGEDEREIAGFHVRSVVTPHAPEVVAAARRFEAGGRVAVYSGDTQPNPAALVPLATGADLLVHECYSEEWLQRLVARMAPEAGARTLATVTATHSEVLDAARIAQESGARRLALTHLNRGEDAEALRRKAGRVFKGEVLIAHDGLAVEL